MTFEYTPHNRLYPDVDTKLCRASVHDSYGASFHQCCRKPVPGSKWCKQHDPEQEKARRERARKEWDEKHAADKRARITYGLSNATMEQLLAEIERRKEKPLA